MSFYVTLPSDSSLNYFPDNTLSKFRAYLPEIIQLNGPFEVGLAEVSYPRTWNNVTKEQVVEVSTDDLNTIRSLPDFANTKEVTIPMGTFTSIKEIIEKLKFQETAVFTYNTHTKRVSIELEKKYFCKLPPEIAMMMGFTDKRETHVIGKSMVAPYTVDMSAGLHSLFVYTDVIKNTIVGDQKAPLLRIISVKGEYGETMDALFTQPHYLPVAGSSIQIIEINIMDDLGDPVRFERGKVHVTLHFRPRRDWIPL